MKLSIFHSKRVIVVSPLGEATVVNQHPDAYHFDARFRAFPPIWKRLLDKYTKAQR